MSSSGPMGSSEATLRFYAELNDFLQADRRKTDIPVRFHVSPTVKDAIESLGVPHVEVDLILVNGASVGFEHRLADGDRVSVYPVFESLDIGPVVRLRGTPLRRTAFVADVHLRRLARFLRLLGFDTLHSNDLRDAELVAISAGEGRILLTRDRQLLKHGRVKHGYWVRSTDPVEQAREVVRRFDLAERVKPFSRCPTCNGRLGAVEKETVAAEIPPKTARWLDEYVRCDACGKLYWRGTHFERLEGLIERILEDPD
jgi:uncharacterized protein with PIN domain/sulfur carrier protein ThiS